MAWNTNLPASVATGTLLTPANFMNPVVENIAELEWAHKKSIHITLGGPDMVTAPTATSYTDCKGITQGIPADLSDAAEVYFEATLYIQSAGATAYAQLVINGSAVSGSEITRTGTTTPGVVRSGNIAAQLTGTNLVEMKVQAKTSNGSYVVSVYDPRLVIEKA